MLHRLFIPIVLTMTWPVAACAQDGQEAVEDNAEIAAIFEADQADRRNPNPDWAIISAADEKRWQRTRELFEEGELVTGMDYYRAAFVFQHGHEPRSFLLAHALAVRALALGVPQAEWIAAATLDRYLHRTESAQIYGTQYLFNPEDGASMGEYDRDLLTDGLREASGVPPIAKQEERLEAMRQRMASPAKDDGEQ